MVNILMRCKVIDFNQFQAEFDADDSWRRSGGEQNFHLFRDADDLSMVTVLLGWDDFQTGQLFVDSHRFRRQLQDGGVIGEPTFFIMNEVESRD